MKRGAILIGVAFTLLSAAFLIAEFVVAGQAGAPIDDGWIYMAFARSIAEGDGMTYPGYDGPLASVTGPIWCLLLALAHYVFDDPVVAGKLTGFAAGLFALFGTWRLASVATADRQAALWACVLLAVTPRFVWGALSMMEVPFYVGAVTLGLALHLERRAVGLRSWSLGLVLLCLAGWARPECFVFPVLVALHRRRVDGLLLVGFLLALYPAYHLWIYGHPLPTTFYAKAASGSPMSTFKHEGFGAALLALMRDPSLESASFVGYLPTYLPLIVPGFFLGIRRGLREKSGVPFVAAVMVLFILARGALGFHHPSFQYGRYYAHIWPLFLIVCLYGFDLKRVDTKGSVAILVVVAATFVIAPVLVTQFAFDRFAGLLLTSSQAAALFWGSAVFGLVLAISGLLRSSLGRPPVWAIAIYLLPALWFGLDRHGHNVKDTEIMNVVMARKCNELVPEGDLIACHDIGALGYFAHRPMLDLAGLGSPEVVFSERLPDGRFDIPALLAKYRPKWLVITNQMLGMVNPGGKLPPGVEVPPSPVFSISHPENITLAGNNYHLLKITWQ